MKYLLIITRVILMKVNARIIYTIVKMECIKSSLIYH